MVKHLEDLFPGLRGTPYRVTSPPDDAYNCIAWAAGVATAWWWPFGDPQRTYWPESVPRLENVDAFRDAFGLLGYTVCDREEAEPGYEKIALFADASRTVTHAARQVAPDRWTSKLGKLEDIEHGLHDLEGTEYGSVILLMRRPLPAEVAPAGGSTS